MATSLGELFIQLAFEGDTSKAEKFKKKILEVSKAGKKSQMSFGLAKTSLLKYITAIVGAVYAVQRLTDSLVKQNQQFMNLTRTSDMALSTFQKWDSVGKMFGINNAADQIKNLNDRLFELKLTGAGAEGFIMAGITVRANTDAEDVMEQLRERIKGLSDTAASNLLQRLGIDPNMLHLLRMTKEEFASLTAEMKKYQLTDEQRKSIQEMNIQLQIASQKLQYLKDRAVLAIMPFWTKLVSSFAGIAVMLAKVIWKFKEFIAIGVILSAKFKPMIKLFRNLQAMFLKMLRTIPLIGTKLSHLFRGFAPLAGLTKMLSRFLIPLTALYLLLDDISVWMDGGDSAIGRIINWIKDLIDGTLSWKDALLDVVETVVALLEMITNFFTFGLYDKLKKYDLEHQDTWWGKLRIPIGHSDNDLQRMYGTQNNKHISNSNTQNNNQKINQYNTIYTNETLGVLKNGLSQLSRTTITQMM